MELNEIIKDSDRLYMSDAIPESYHVDSYVEEVAKVGAVALANTAKEVEDLVAYAIDNDMVIIARGSGTSVAGSQVPISGGELIIDVSRMNRIIELDEETLTVTLEPGVLLADLQKYVQNHGYYYPPDPGSKHSSIGGNVVMNAGGMRAVKYGTTKDYVRAMDVVLPTGELLTLGSLNIKDSSGYDLKNLFIGSEGTLGILTEIKLKVIPMPKASQTTLLAFDTTQDATDSVLKILKADVDPTALELFERSTIKYSEEFTETNLPSQKGNTYVLMTLEGDSDALIEPRSTIVQHLLKDKVVEAVPLDVEQEKIAWNLRDNILIALLEFTQFEMLDEVVPLNRFAEMMNYTKQLEAKHDLKVVNFGHAGDGNIHTVLMRENLDKETWQAKRKVFLDDLYQKVSELGGLPAAEHGIGIVKKPYLLKMKDTNEINLMKKIKQAIDPDNRLNPGKIF